MLLRLSVYVARRHQVLLRESRLWLLGQARLNLHLPRKQRLLHEWLSASVSLTLDEDVGVRLSVRSCGADIFRIDLIRAHCTLARVFVLCLRNDLLMILLLGSLWRILVHILFVRTKCSTVLWRTALIWSISDSTYTCFYLILESWSSLSNRLW